MRDGRDIVALFVAEARMRRLVRCQVFAFILFALVIASYIALSLLQYYAPNASVFSGAYSPRFAVAVMGELWILMAQVGIFFLLFDSRARDGTEGVTDLLEVRPIGPCARAVGSLLAATVISWAVLAIALLFVQSFAVMCQFFSVRGATAGIWWLAVPMQGSSLGGFLLLDAPPSLFFAGALTQLLATVFRARLLVVGCFMLGLSLYIYSVGGQPTSVSAVIATVSRYGMSDLVPRFAEGQGLIRSAAYMTMGLALCAITVVVASGFSITRPHAVAGVMFGLTSCLLLVGLINDEATTTRLRAQWLAALEDAATSVGPNIRHIEGTIVLDPGERMVIDVELQLEMQPTPPPTKVALALNPGLAVDQLTVGDRLVAYRQAKGLLEFELQDHSNSEFTTIAMRAVGVPDERYSYLEEERDWRLDTRSSPRLLLGTKASIYEAKYVALMPTIAWLPMAPASLTGHAPDFFSLDVTVQAPLDWSVVTTGDRSTTFVDGRHRFVSASPVQRAALFAAPLARSAIAVRGVELELFMSKMHVREASYFKDIVDIEGGVSDYAAEMFDRARTLGLPYPYKQLSFVEVPAELRTYGGSWRQDTEMATPGIMLVHEYGFPTRRYRRPSDQARDPDDSLKVNTLLSTFTFNLQGGNYHQLGRNLFHFQTSAHGAEATIIDQLCLELTIDLMWPGRRILDGEVVSLGGFSAHQYASDEFGISIGPFFGNLRTGQMPNRNTVAEEDSQGIWEQMERVALVDLPTAGRGRGVDLLLLKTRLMRETIFSHLGFDEVANVLEKMRRRYHGGTFGVEDLFGMLEDAGVPGGVLGNWLGKTQLPGFVFSNVAVEKIGGRAAGAGYYLSVHVRNSEPVVGAFRLMYDQQTNGIDWYWHDSDVAFVEPHTAVKIGVTVPQLPREVWLDPFLSLNRRPAKLFVEQVVRQSDGVERRVGAQESSWQPSAEEEYVFVDDQDNGFFVRGMVGRQLLWEADRSYWTGWVRQEQATAWGRYFRTVARTRGEGAAEFIVELSGGRWNLEYHLPDIGVQTWGYTRRRREDKHGLYRFRIAVADFVEESTLAAADAEPGWNAIGSFELPHGKVSVAVSNGTADGESTIYADAIRWSREPGSEDKGAQSSTADASASTSSPKSNQRALEE